MPIIRVSKVNYNTVILKHKKKEKFPYRDF